MKPTIFVDIDSQYENNPIARALKIVAEAFGAALVEQLVRGDVEADIAVTNSVAIALRMIKETEHTSIVLAHFDRQQQETATAFANRYDNRVTAVPFIGSGSEMEAVLFLEKLIAEKTKGV